jgi:hypothetical protein
MMGLSKGWLVGLAFILSALVFFGIACSDDEDSPENAVAQLCEDLGTLEASLASIPSITGDSTVEDVKAAQDDVNNAVDDVKSSAGDVANSSGLENAGKELESAVNDVPDDATLSEALTSIQPAVQGVRSAWVQAQATVDCASAPVDDPLSNPQGDPLGAPVTGEPDDGGQPTDDAAS